MRWARCCERCGGVFDDIETVIPAAEREAFERVAEELGVSPPRLAQLLGDVP